MILGAIPPLPDMVFTPSDPTRRFSSSGWVTSEWEIWDMTKNCALKNDLILQTVASF
jgi:hypothetical protein